MTTWVYPAVVIRVVDGDTVRMQLDLGLHIWRTDNCRIAGINAPEMSTPEGRDAKAYAELLLPVGAAVTFHSKALDKYGRPLGDIDIGGTDFGAAMIAAGQAVPYNGGAR